MKTLDSSLPYSPNPNPTRPGPRLHVSTDLASSFVFDPGLISASDLGTDRRRFLVDTVEQRYTLLNRNITSPKPSDRRAILRADHTNILSFHPPKLVRSRGKGLVTPLHSTGHNNLQATGH